MRVLLKREDLAPHRLAQDQQRPRPGAARRAGWARGRLLAETGAGQHGVAAATAAALLGLECVVYMGEVDVVRQELNVFRMQLLGAEVRPVSSGIRTLKDAINEALRDWVASVETTHYCIGSVVGPHPYPYMVRELQRIVGDEARAQCREMLGGATPISSSPASAAARTRRAPSPASPTPRPPSSASRRPGARRSAAALPGIVHGMASRFLQDEDGQILEAHSISAGLDYPGVGPEHAYLAAIGRARYESVDDDEVVAAFRLLAETEGIIPALEPAHALAWLVRAAASGEVAARRDGDGDPLGARRQGRRAADGAPRVTHRRGAGGRARPPRTGAAPSARRRPQAARPLHHRRPRRGVAGGRRRPRGRRRGRHRDRHPLLDPVMDGPVIQEASERALRAGATPAGIIGSLVHLDAEVPLAVMTYVNIVAHAGYRRMASELAAAGVAGAIVPDLPLDEAGEWRAEAAAAGVDAVLLAAPTTPDERLAAICGASRGFVYAVGLLGVTGERARLGASALEIARRCRAFTDTPVLVGVGVSNPEQAAEVCAVADGVVVGSALVRRLLDGGGASGAADFVASLRRAIDAG